MFRGLVLLALLLVPSTVAAQEAEEYRVKAAEIFAYDRALPLESEMEVEAESKTWVAYRVTYRSAWGNRGVASYVLPRGDKEIRRPCVMLLHGHPGNRKDYRPHWNRFIDIGLALFIPDAWGHGERTRENQAEFFGIYPYETRNMLIQSVIDYRRGIDFLQSRPEIDGSRIGMMGVSMGGILGSLLAGADDRVRAPIIVVAGADWKTMFATSVLPEVVRARKALSREEIEFGFRAMDPVDPRHWIGKISPRPVLLINGDADRVVPVAGNRILHAAAREPKTILWYRGGHLPMGKEGTRVKTAMVEWLRKHLQDNEY